MLNLSTLQETIETALKANTTLWGSGKLLADIAPYEGQAEDYLTGKAQAIPRTPAVLILLDSGSFQNRTVDYSHEHRVEITLLIVSGDYRGTSFRKKELYQIFDAVRASLDGKRLGLAITPLAPVDWNTSFEGQRHSGMELVYETTADEDITIER